MTDRTSMLREHYRATGLTDRIKWRSRRSLPKISR